MKVTYDDEAKAAYIFMKDPKECGKIVKSIPVTENIIIDMGSNGELFGVEILNPELSIGKKNLRNLKKEKSGFPSLAFTI